MTGAKIILNCKYFKKGTVHKAALKNLVNYIATREGVQKISVSEKYQLHPPTTGQLNLIQKLEKEFGISYDLPEFEDYISNKNQWTASGYISAMIDHNLNKVLTKKNLVEYIGKRPGTARDKVLNHGLFCISDNGTIAKDVDIHAVMEEAGNHQGRVWTNVLSLRREDAHVTGYENRDKWIALFRAKVNSISEQMNIPIQHLKAYGAFHDEGHHPHCHFIVYSDKPGNESLYSKGIKKLKSEFAHGIFPQQMLDTAKTKSDVRDEIRAKSKEEIKKLAEQLESKGFSVSSELETRMVNLSRKLSKHGKKFFRFLPADLKQEVIQIVDLLAQEPEISALYEKWKGYQIDLHLFYKNNETLNILKLSEDEAFRPVLNAVLKEAWAIRQWLDENPERDYERKFDTGTVFEVKRYYNDSGRPPPIENAYGNIISQLAGCFNDGALNAPVKHFDSTMDSKHQEEQRALKKRLGISM